MKTLSALKIEQPFIALFGSGNSVHELSKEELALIRARAFMITINYAPVHLTGHLNMWSDHKVSAFLEQYYERNPKTCLFLARESRVKGKLLRKVDYWFSQKKENIKGNYTIVWALQLLEKYFPDKIILLFGVDMYAPNSQEAKWYDRYIKYDQVKRGTHYNIGRKLDQCAQQINRYCAQDQVINCNPKSRLDYFPKGDWRKILQLKNTERDKISALIPKFITRSSARLLTSFTKKKVMKHSIKELYQRYQGEDIYLFGTGPSLFKVDPAAYEDKICFGINYSFEVMPHMDHIFVHVVETYDAICRVVDNKKLVLPETLVHQWYKEPRKNKRPSRIPTHNTEALIYRIQDPREKNLNKKRISLAEDTDFFTWSCTTHSAIHIAAYAGAKNIYLIGMDYKLFPDGKVHFESKHSKIYGQQNWHALKKHQAGDEWITKKLEILGVNVLHFEEVSKIEEAPQVVQLS